MAEAQLKVGGPLCSRSVDMIRPGRVVLVDWALAEGCPGECELGVTMAIWAARYGHVELLSGCAGRLASRRAST